MTQDKTRSTILFDKDLDARLSAETGPGGRSGMTRTAWVVTACREKFARMDGGLVADGDLAGLSPDDAERIRRYIEVLRNAPLDTPLRRAVDDNFDLYDWVARKM
jgi:hypothetical protein